MQVAAAAALVLVLFGCGGYGDEATPAEQPAESTPVETTEENGGTSYSLLRIEHDEERRPAGELYGVFSRERTPADERAQSQVERFGSPGNPSENSKGPDLGIARPETTRLLLDGIEGPTTGLAAALTTSGAVCFSLLPNGGGSCSVPGDDGFELAASEGRDLVVFGLVSDAVTAVDVVGGGERRRAQLGTNGFAIVLDGTFEELDAVVIHRENRAPEKIPLS
jgi:hypothetical protein